MSHSSSGDGSKKVKKNESNDNVQHEINDILMIICMQSPLRGAYVMGLYRKYSFWKNSG